MKEYYASSNKALITLLFVLSIGGLSGALPFILQPDGSLLGMSTSSLSRSPVDDYFWPGIFLLVVMVMWPLVNLYGITANKSWASMAIVALGIVTISWIIYQAYIISAFSPFQPFVLIIGLGLLIGGLRRMSR
jgi:hypothetical protein